MCYKFGGKIKKNQKFFNFFKKILKKVQKIFLHFRFFTLNYKTSFFCLFLFYPALIYNFFEISPLRILVKGRLIPPLVKINQWSYGFFAYRVLQMCYKKKQERQIFLPFFKKFI